MRILVVEDEPQLNAVVTKQLVSEHYSVDSCLSGSDALDHLRLAEYDAILLDILLPGVNGLQILSSLRKSGDKTPVLLLTALDAVSDRVQGLDAGADDYLVKPFSLEELLARVRALVRRGAGHVENSLTVSDLSIDRAARTVTRGGEVVSLTSREFDVLEYLALNAGVVLSREKLCQHLWNYDYEGGSNVIDVYIRYLRRKLDEGRNIKLIHTVRGAGYVLRAEAAAETGENGDEH